MRFGLSTLSFVSSKMRFLLLEVRYRSPGMRLGVAGVWVEICVVGGEVWIAGGEVGVSPEFRSPALGFGSSEMRLRLRWQQGRMMRWQQVI